jgi:Transmembrane domain of unknown function (DUF3566)
VDQRVEPPSWLPGGAASSDTKGSASQDPVADDPDGEGLDSKGAVTFGAASQDPVNYDPVVYPSAGSGLGSPGSAPHSPAGDAGRGDAASTTAYSYGADTRHPNGLDAPFGSEPSAVGAYSYGPESGLAGGVASPPPYPAQVGETGVPTEQVSDVGRRTAALTAAPRKGKTGATPARRADLVLARLEPWSVMKFSFLISLVAWVILFVAVAVLWFALDSLGVFTSVQKTLESVTSSSGSAGVSLTKWFSASRILGYTMLIGAVNIVLITALSTVGAMIYNLVTHLGGGIEVTLRETD